MTTSQIDGGRQVKAATITGDRLVAATVADDRLVVSYTKADGTRAFTNDQSFGAHKIISLADGVADSDGATWGQVKAFVGGKDYKDSVRAATTANGALATAFANGQVIDGVTLATNDSILLKNQTTGAENGIYVVNASGAPTRRSDADVSSEVTGGLTVRVTEGTVNADAEFTLTTNDPITLGTTSLTFVNTSPPGGGFTTAGAGLTSSGVTVDAVATDASILVGANDFAVQKDDASLEVGAAGLRVKHGTSGQVYVANASGVLTPVTLSGDATITAAGVLTLAATVVNNADVVTRETPTGSVNGANTTFTLANTPVAGTEQVFLNGILQEPGAGNDYTIATNTITYLTAPLTGDRIRVSYIK